jgi:flagellar capping protein FliD
MGTINFPGLATGVDTTQIVKQIMAVRGRRLANYKVGKLHMEEKQTSFDELKSKVSTLERAADALSDTENMETFTASTSDGSRMGVAATSEANPGAHSVVINQMATSETWIQDSSSFDYETEYVGAGDFIFSYNNKERVITATSTTTLEDFAGLINNDEDNPGITASLLYQGGKYHLMLSGRETGEDFQISVNSSSTEVWKPDTSAANHTFTNGSENAVLSDKLVDLDQWTNAHTGAETITISGTNNTGTTILPSRALTISDDTTLEHLVKEINYHFEGFAKARMENGQIILTDSTSGVSSLSMSLTYTANGSGATLGLPTMAVSSEGGSSTATLTELAPSTFTQTQDAQNSQIKLDNYTPTPVAEVQTITPDVVASSGTYTLSYGGVTTDPIAYNASTTDVQTELNSLSTITAIGNVTVSGDPLTSTNGMTVTFASSAGNTSMLSINTGSLTGPTSVTVSETTRGNNEEWVSRNSNVVTDALTGITLILQDTNDTDDSDDPIPIEITVSRDTSSVKGKVTNMLTSYNNLLAYLREKTEYDNETKSMGMFSSDIAVTLIKEQIKSPFIGTTTGFSSEDAYFNASDIGISFDGRGKMEFDESTFNDAIEDDYLAVLNVLGAAAKGNSDSDTVEFYSASEKYTTAGAYDFQVVVAAGVITSAKIKLSTETGYRDMTISDNLVSGNETFDETGYGPVYSENGLYLNVDLTSDGTFTGTVNVKQGMAGALESTLMDITEINGRLDVAKESLGETIQSYSSFIQSEQKRLDTVEQYYVQRFARLEKNLQLLQRQMAAVGQLGGLVGL